MNKLDKLQSRDPKKNLVFVYGSLKRGFSNHHLLSNKMSAILVVKGITQLEYSLIDLGCYPAIALKPTSQVTGELYRVTDACLEELDWLEGYPNYYTRSQVNILGSIKNFARKAWMYHFTEESAKGYEGSTVIESGTWSMKKLYKAYR